MSSHATGLRFAVFAALRIALVFLVVAWAFDAMAFDKSPPSDGLGKGCGYQLFCDAQSTNGICTVGTNEAVAKKGNIKQVTAYASRSTASAFTCQMHTNTTGYNGGADASVVVAGSDLTPTARMVQLNGNFHYYWWVCSGIVGGAVTVEAIPCDAN